MPLKLSPLNISPLRSKKSVEITELGQIFNDFNGYHQYDSENINISAQYNTLNQNVFGAYHPLLGYTND